jgi:hypothetical protein
MFTLLLPTLVLLPILVLLPVLLVLLSVVLVLTLEVFLLVVALFVVDGLFISRVDDFICPPLMDLFVDAGRDVVLGRVGVLGRVVAFGLLVVGLLVAGLLVEGLLIFLLAPLLCLMRCAWSWSGDSITRTVNRNPNINLMCFERIIL